MNCRGCWQRFLPLLDLSRKIEGDCSQGRVSSPSVKKWRSLMQRSTSLSSNFTLALEGQLVFPK